MCGRYSLIVEMEQLLIYYGIQPSAYAHTPRYNIAPGQSLPAIIADADGTRRIGPLRWGLVPSWAKEEKVGYMMINARAETLADKPAFRKLLPSRRCILPADGFYEWRKLNKNEKQPYRITLKDKSLFSMAGLYDTWISPSGDKVNTCTIITTVPNELMQPIHDRMPVILPPEHVRHWLNKEITDLSQLMQLLQPYSSEQMRLYPVNPLVGSVKNDSPACIEPYQIPQQDRDSTVQLELF